MSYLPIVNVVVNYRKFGLHSRHDHPLLIKYRLSQAFVFFSIISMDMINSFEGFDLGVKSFCVFGEPYDNI